MRVGDLLLERGLVTQEQIDHALAEQKVGEHSKLLGEVLVQLGYITEDQVLEALADNAGVPFAKLTPELADPEVIGALPRDFIESHMVLPLFRVHDTLTVAIHEPSNVFLLEEIAQQCGCQVQFVASPANDIRATIEAIMPDANVFVIDDIVDNIADDDVRVVEHAVTDLADLDVAADESPVIKLVNYLIYAAVQDGASDIHIEPGDKSLRVRFRVDGVLFEKLRPPHQMHAPIVSRVKIMGGMDISERRIPQDGAITVMLNKTPIDLRVSTMPGKVGEKVVMRVVDNRNAVTNLEGLGFSHVMLEQFRSLVHQPNGVVLVTGPTGSGKTTTLYAGLSEITNEEVNTCTVEDPVEYNLEGVNQFQTNDRAGFTFASALRSLLRQDPDVVMVGEIRDQETAKIAIQAALTGHLVLSTLHTNDAPSAITRLSNIGVEPYLVAASIRGVLAQRLIRKICTNCKETVEPTPAIRKSLESLPEGQKVLDSLFHGRGCTKCHNTGYSGRLGIYELFQPDDEALDAISRGAGLQEVRSVARASGCLSLRQDGLEKARAGLTTVEEVFTATAA